MSIFSYVIIAIAAVVLVIICLYYLAKGLMYLAFWFLKILPSIIQTTIFWAILVIGYNVLRFTRDFPAIPFFIYLLLYLIVLALILIRKYVKYGSIYGRSSGYNKSYVLNKKSKVIHRKYSNSEETIGPHHRKELSSSEAEELISKNPKYRFKGDN